MRSARSDYEEIKEIKENLDALKSNVVALTRHLQENGVKKAQAVSDDLQERTLDAADAFIAEGEREIEMLQDQVKSNPAKSMLLAFGVGVLASVLLGRR
jgi:ElaB/YqjD/DUF883 family membrane-anchored ribosome-binding protein